MLSTATGQEDSSETEVEVTDISGPRSTARFELQPTHPQPGKSEAEPMYFIEPFGWGFVAPPLDFGGAEGPL